ncbi:MAG: hypothetical protein Q7J29_07410 [Stagnimonas sp.]|nr:hypothetical protein [Stagnimonas sp.]
MPNQEALVNDLARTVETHIAGKSGIAGMAMKMGFHALRSAKPDIAVRATRTLLPDISQALDPLHAEFKSGNGEDFGSFLGQHAERAAQLVIGAADRRIGSIENSTAKAVYQRFRGSAGDELQKLLPALGQVLARHIA